MPQFAPLVESGAKRQTIRPVPKRMPRAGDMESWRAWMGLPYRSKQRELARVKLTLVSPIIMDAASVTLDGQTLTMDQIRQLAAQDGFEKTRHSTSHFFAWFYIRYDSPFSGILIRAEDEL